MTTDVDARLQADAEHWRHAQHSRTPVPLATAFAVAVPELDADAPAVSELTAGPPPPRRTPTHRRWVWAAVAAAVVLLAGAGAGAGVISHRLGGPSTAAGRLEATSWVAPGAGTGGYATTVTFEVAAGKLTVSDGCDTSPYHLTVGPGTLRIGGIDGVNITCSPAGQPPGLYPAAGDPSVAAHNTLDAVLQGTVTWAIDNRTLILRRGGHTATLYATETIAERCAATEVTVAAAGATHRYGFGPPPRTVTVKAPVDVDAAASGPCRAGFAITLAPATKPFAWISHNRYGQWRVTRSGTYQLTFTLNGCTSTHNSCSLALRPLQVIVQVDP